MSLETIALTASIICALTAVTTSLRALGKSREYSQHEPHVVRKMLLLYLVVTIIWFVLSIVFVAPTLIQKWLSEERIWIFTWVLLFLLPSFLIWYIWRRILLSIIK